MCMKRPKTPPPQKIAAYDNNEAIRQADIESRLRRRRSGAAANILTSPLGVPAGESTATVGGTA